MSSNKPSPDTSNQGWFNKFIALLTALGGGVGIVALFVYFLGSPNGPEPPRIPEEVNKNGPISLPRNENGRAVEFCSSNFPNQYQDCLKAARNCDPSSVTYEPCVIGEMGHLIISH